MTVSKVVKCARKISAYGGINFVIDHLERSGVPGLFDSFFSPRVKQAKYSYSSVLLSWIYANFCGAERLEDIMAIKEDLEKRPEFKVPSSDRISQIFRSFATEKLEYTTNQSEHEFNLHPELNRLMLSTAVHLGQIKGQILDYDNTIIYNKKWDSKMTYKHEPGYQPGVAFIGKTPVYIENRNGNSPALYKIDESIDRALQNLDDHDIQISHFRSDSAAYDRKLIKLISGRNLKFVIKAKLGDDLTWDLDKCTEWKKAPFYGKRVEVSNQVREFGGTKCRYVCFREPAYFKKQKYHYWAYLTNEFDWSEEKVARFYFHRGESERNFDDLKNNFNWSRVPFSLMNENTVFMIISAIASIIYYHVLSDFCKKADWLKRTFRLKNFRFYFINVAAWWGKYGELSIDSQRMYEVLLE